ncbi:hypothetical protein BKA62DRAFT_673735 [Auriculariales sp. MPI-PUGE-AT-0066]|nr:hypothetical protein BKA62DRAFT_673735 [Auriculariales sp. MPI-PUGE-AT-0066]
MSKVTDRMCPSKHVLIHELSIGGASADHGSAHVCGPSFSVACIPRLARHLLAFSARMWSTIPLDSRPTVFQALLQRNVSSGAPISILGLFIHPDTLEAFAPILRSHPGTTDFYTHRSDSATGHTLHTTSTVNASALLQILVMPAPLLEVWFWKILPGFTLGIQHEWATKPFKCDPFSARTTSHHTHISLSNCCRSVKHLNDFTVRRVQLVHPRIEDPLYEPWIKRQVNLLHLEDLTICANAENVLIALRTLDTSGVRSVSIREFGASSNATEELSARALFKHLQRPILGPPLGASIMASFTCAAFGLLNFDSLIHDLLYMPSLETLTLILPDGILLSWISSLGLSSLGPPSSAFLGSTRGHVTPPASHSTRTFVQAYLASRHGSFSNNLTATDRDTPIELVSLHGLGLSTEEVKDARGLMPFISHVLATPTFNENENAARVFPFDGSTSEYGSTSEWTYYTN